MRCFGPTARTRYEAHSIGLNNGFLSVNEVRLEEGRDRIEGGDQYRVPLEYRQRQQPQSRADQHARRHGAEPGARARGAAIVKFVSARAFKAAIKRDRKAADDLVVRKLFVSQPEQADDDLIRFTITTSAVDRERDVLELDGWELGNYQRNPVVLWGHEA